MKIEKISGLVAAPFAPMKDDGELNLEIISPYYNLLKNNGVAGAFINGTTGEGVSLTMDEKKSVVEAWVESGKESECIKIINLVGGTSVKDCIELAMFSFDKGLHAISVIAPHYMKPSTITELASFIKEIADEVPDMPVYFYHIPAFTGVNFSMLELLKISKDSIPNFAGIKYTHNDFMDFFSCLNYAGGYYDILWGTDQALTSALVLGCKGAVGSTYNYIAPIFNSIINNFESGNIDRALELQLQANEIIYLLCKYGGIRTGKAFMRYIGLNCGKFRTPLNTFDEDTYRNLCKDIEALGIADNIFSTPEKKLS